METKGQINYTVNARTIGEHLPQISHGLQTGENMMSWNPYNHGYSRTMPKTSFYEDEYKQMVSRMDKKGVSVKRGKTVDPFGELLQLSVLADRSRDLGHVESLPPSAPPPWKKNSRVSIHSLIKWKRYQDEKHRLFMSMMQKLEMRDVERFRHLEQLRKQQKMSFGHGEYEQDFRQGSTSEQREGDFWMSNTSEGDSSMSSLPDCDFMRGSAPDEDLRMSVTQSEDFRKVFVQNPVLPVMEKRMTIAKEEDQDNTTKRAKVSVCRHFMKGWCRQGDACSFQHVIEGSHPDTQKVFLGGLPHSITPVKLLWELRQQGYKVVNQPKIFRGFSPQVCLSSTEEAMKMLQQGKIMICGCTIDVRPYKASTKKERDRQLDTNNRSIFLGGLPPSVTVQILKAEIEKMGMKVTNRPLIKAGFIPKVTLASTQQAQELIAKGTIDITGAVVSVRPYVSKNKPS